jgi:hypothetical protein
MDAEKGQPSTSIAIYAALLLAYDLLGQLDEVADPAGDERGQALAQVHERKRARKSAGLSDDF